MAEGGFKRKLTAVLSADVAGYSRLMGEDEAGTVRTLTAYRRIMGEMVRQHRGRVIDSPGDNILSEFASVVNAVQCAVAAQNEFKARNAGLPEHRRMEFRIGVNLGDVIEEEGRIYGDGVNIAARLEALADPGGICISKSAFDHIESKLPLGYEYLGEQTVKNIARPVGVYRVLMEPRVTVAEVRKTEEAVPVWRRRAFAAGVAAMALVIMAALIWNFYLRRPTVEPASVERMAFPLPDKPSLAVLPFANMIGDPGQDYIGDGISEEIIATLSKIPQLFVIDRNSSFSYKGNPVKTRQVAEDLGVRYILEGAVRRSENRLRITARLIDTLKGNHIWSERYERDLKNLFAVQDEITLKILTELGVKLTLGEEARLWAKGTEDMEAYLKVLQGRHYINLQTKESNVSARQMATEAIALDPGFPTAYTLLGSTHLLDMWLGSSKSPKESLERAEELYRRAIALDDSHAPAHSALCHVYVHKRMYEEAIAEGERAVALSPNAAPAYAWLGSALRFAGRAEEAVPIYEKAVRLDPFPSAVLLQGLGNAYHMVGRYEESLTALKRALRRDPDNLFVHLGLARAYVAMDQEKEARAAAAEVMRMDPGFSLERYAKILPFRKQVDKDRILSQLRKAGLPEHPPLPLPDKPSIAVLPFVNMSGDPEQEYFSDGITEEIITWLSKVPGLFVTARNSTFTYKGRPVKVREVGRELGVRYVMEGSVRKFEDRVRVTAQLIDVMTERHVWADRYERELKDVFAIQDEITMTIIVALQVELTEGDQAALRARGTRNLEAYLKYLQAANHFKRFRKESNFLARRKFHEAVALAPEYASAYAGIAWTYILEPWQGWSPSPQQSITLAMEHAQKCLTLDESLSDAHSALGLVYLVMRHWDKAVRECELAVSLNPNSADSMVILAMVFRTVGRVDEALALLKKAVRLNPMPPDFYLHEFGSCYRLMGRYDEAIAMLKRVLDRNPDYLSSRLNLIATYIMSGKEEAANAEAARVLKESPDFSVERFLKDFPYKDQKILDGLGECLLRAGLK